MSILNLPRYLPYIYFSFLLYLCVLISTCNVRFFLSPSLLIAYPSYLQTTSHSPSNTSSVFFCGCSYSLLILCARALNFSVLWPCHQWVRSWMLFPYSCLATCSSGASLSVFVLPCISTIHDFRSPSPRIAVPFSLLSSPLSIYKLPNWDPTSTRTPAVLPVACHYTQ